MSSSDLVLIAGSIIILSIVAKIVTDLHKSKRIRLLRNFPPFPRIVLLILVGLILGPGLGLLGYRVIAPSTFGDALPAIVGLAVAVILFEGGFSLDIAEVFSEKHSLKLIIIGVPITFVLTGVTIWFALSIQPELAFLIAALLIATGPTVIEPILSQVEVSSKVERVLHTEGVVNDAIAAVLAVVIFEFAVLSHTSGGHGSESASAMPIPPQLATSFIVRIAVGIFLGCLIGWVVYIWLLKADVGAENTRLAVLAVAILAFLSAESIIGEAGIVSSTVAGAVLGNAEYIPPSEKPIPHKEHVQEFGSDITTLVLGIIFIILAAMMSVEDLRGILIPGLAVVGVVMFIIRPLSVFVSLYHRDEAVREFDIADLTYISAVGPRGIVPASVATLFSVRLAAEGTPNASAVAGLVFLVIVTTVVVEGPLGVYLPDFLFPEQQGVAIVGGGRMGRRLADKLDQSGDRHHVIESDRENYERLRGDYYVTHGDGTDKETLEDIITDHDLNQVVAATESDDINLFTSLLAKNGLNIDVHARVNHPENEERWEELGVEAVAPAKATVSQLLNIKPDYITNVRIQNEDLVDATVEDIDLPADVELNRIRRGNQWFSAGSSIQLEKGDELTLFGASEEALLEAREMLHGAVDNNPEETPIESCSKAVIVGGGRIGSLLADSLSDDCEVTVIETDVDKADLLSGNGYEVIVGSGADRNVLEKAGIEEAELLFVVTEEDQTNLLSAEVAIERFEVPAVFSRCNNPAYSDSFADLGIRPVSPLVACADQVFEELQNDSKTDEKTETDGPAEPKLSDPDSETEIEQQQFVISDGLPAGAEIRDIIPDRVAVIKIQRGEKEIHRPDQHTELQEGDQITIYGPDFVVEELVNRF